MLDMGVCFDSSYCEWLIGIAGAGVACGVVLPLVPWFCGMIWATFQSIVLRSS